MHYEITAYRDRDCRDELYSATLTLSEAADPGSLFNILDCDMKDGHPANVFEIREYDFGVYSKIGDKIRAGKLHVEKTYAFITACDYHAGAYKAVMDLTATWGDGRPGRFPMEHVWIKFELKL